MIVDSENEGEDHGSDDGNDEHEQETEHKELTARQVDAPTPLEASLSSPQNSENEDMCKQLRARQLIIFPLP